MSDINSPIQTYTASAGAGKTYKLAYFYIKFLFQEQENYMRAFLSGRPEGWKKDAHIHILAVTFTNKSTTEMKQRIVQSLYELTCEDYENTKYAKDYSKDLCKDIDLLKSTDNDTALALIRDVAKKLLNDVLQHYSIFSVMTIDMFFQHILRSFINEMGIEFDYDVVLKKEEVDSVRAEALDTIVKSITESDNGQLLKGLISLATDSIDVGNSWNPIRDIENNVCDILEKEAYLLAKNGFTATDKEILDTVQKCTKILKDEVQKAKFKDDFKKLVEEINRICGGYISVVKKAPRYVLEHPDEISNSYIDFSFIGEFGDFVIDDKGTIKIFSGNKKNEIKKIKELPDYDRLVDLCIKLNSFWNTAEYRKYYTAYLIKNQLIKISIARKVEEQQQIICKDKDIMFLSSTAEFINKIVSQSSTPFIYEKTGLTIKHYMIDEFQDTSKLQWENFVPLIRESVANGTQSFIVGDIKQSIYRWRNGDLNILKDGIDEEFGEKNHTQNLEKNFRSDRNIVKFNNAIYHQDALPAKYNIGEYYDTSQQEPDSKKEGYVEWCWCDNKGKVNEKVADILKEIKEKGLLGKTAVLTRSNAGGEEIASLCVQNEIPFISIGTLCVGDDYAVKFIVAVLAYLLRPYSPFYRANLVSTYTLLNAGESINVMDSKAYSMCNKSASIADFEQALFGDKTIQPELKAYVLEAIIKKLVDSFNLETIHNGAHLAFLNTFRDKVKKFSKNNFYSIPRFLSYWKDVKSEVCVDSGEVADALTISTIHKAKGLEFPIVIVPYVHNIGYHGAFTENKLLFNMESVDYVENIPVVLLKQDKKLALSEFNEQSEQEDKNVNLDDLNTLYVATTRPKSQLYLMGSKNYGIVPNLRKSIVSAIDGKEGDENEGHIGDKEKSFNELLEIKDKKSEKEKPEENNDKVEKYKFDSIETAPIKEKYEDWRLYRWKYLKEELSDAEQVEFGIKCHTLLEEMTPDNVEQLIEKAVLEGIIDVAKQDEYKKVLGDLFKNKEFVRFFDKKYTAYAEVPIFDVKNEVDKSIHSESGIYRIDKLLIDGKKAIVLDYKFVDSQYNYEDKHFKQIGHYAKLMKSLGYEVEAYIIYGNQNVVKKVSQLENFM